jgi:hypothetical protein
MSKIKTKRHYEMSRIVQEILSGTNGRLSSKRIFTLLGFIMIMSGFYGDLIWDLSVADVVFESVTFIVIAGLGFVGAEKFAPKEIKEVAPDE